MLAPVISKTEEYNQISVEIEGLQRKINRACSMLAFIEEQMKVHIGLTSEVATRALEIFKEVLKKRPEDRDYKQIKEDWNQECEKICKIYVQDFEGLVKQRDYCMKSGKPVKITDAIRDDLTRQYQDKVKENLETLKSKIQIDQNTNFEVLIKHLEEDERKSEKLYQQYLNTKIPHNDEKNNLEIKEAKMLKERKKLLEEKIETIFDACQYGSDEFVEKKLKSFWTPFSRKNFLDTPDQNGFCPVHYAAYHNRPGIFIMLLDGGANPQARDNCMYTPIHWAAKSGSLEVVKLLVKKKVDRNTKGEYGRTPLHMAVFNSRIQVTEYLLRNGADINGATSDEDNRKTPLHEAVIHGDLELAKCLLSDPKLDVNRRDIDDHTPLYHVVADGGVPELIALILGHKSYVEPEDKTDPNCIEQLLELTPRYNAEKVKDILKSFRGTVPQ